MRFQKKRRAFRFIFIQTLMQLHAREQKVSLKLTNGNEIVMIKLM